MLPLDVLGGKNAIGLVSGAVGFSRDHSLVLQQSATSFALLSPWRRLLGLDTAWRLPANVHARAQQAAYFRLQLMDASSLRSIALTTFSSLLLEVSKVRWQVQTVLNQLQVSSGGTDLTRRFRQGAPWL
jgi:hypothetical protein